MIYFTFILHFFSIFVVLYYLIFDFQQWIDFFQLSNDIIFYFPKNEPIKPEIILKYWLISIQIKKLLIDGFIICISYFNRFHSYILQKYFLYFNILECLICCIVFFNYTPMFMFGVVCLIWCFLWTNDLFQLNKKLL